MILRSSSRCIAEATATRALLAETTNQMMIAATKIADSVLKNIFIESS
jgi:hypothetical protein